MRRLTVLAVPVATVLTMASAVMAQNAPPPPPAGEPAPPPPPPAPVVVGPTAATAKWYDKAKVEGFVDTYFNLNFNFPRPQTGTNLGRAFDVSNGFALHWAGLNVSYAADPVGGTVGLRFGPGADDGRRDGSESDAHDAGPRICDAGHHDLRDRLRGAGADLAKPLTPTDRRNLETGDQLVSAHDYCCELGSTARKKQASTDHMIMRSNCSSSGRESSARRAGWRPLNMLLDAQGERRDRTAT